MTYDEALTQLDALYATLPQVHCQQRCQASCGVIVMTRVEWIRIQRRLGYRPKGKSSLVCPMLKHGQCAVHTIRPTICRLYGALLDPRMQCPYGCQPERWITEDESRAILATIETLSAAVFPAADPAPYAQQISVAQIEAYIAHAKKTGQVRYE